MSNAEGREGRSRTSEHRTIVSVVRDYGLYAPLGLALSVAEELPRLSEKGRAYAAGRMQTAHLIGRFAVHQGRRRLDDLLEERRSAPTGDRRATPGTADGQPVGGEAARPPDRVGEPEIRDGTTRSNRRARSSRPVESPPPAEEPVRRGSPNGRPAAQAQTSPSAESLAIPGYDTLAASQVVQRLSSLRPDELEEVRRYEMATRGRRTILHRIAQLTAER